MRLLTRYALLTYAGRHWRDWQTRALAGLVRLEAWFRRAIAWWRDDPAAACVFKQLSALAGELAGRRSKSARHRLRRMVRRFENA
jgi:hypothetical protein